MSDPSPYHVENALLPKTVALKDSPPPASPPTFPQSDRTPNAPPITQSPAVDISAE